MSDASLPPASRLPPQPRSGVVLAFDFGEHRIGVAVGDLGLRLAHPVTVLKEAVNDKRFDAIAVLIGEWKPALLVVGVPVHEDGVPHEAQRLCRLFARRLKGRFNLPVRLMDERLSSWSAAQALRETGVKARRRKDMLDAVAAQHILQSYFLEPDRAVDA